MTRERLLYITPSFHPQSGGYAHACTDFVELLARERLAPVEVFTFAPLRDSPEFEREGVVVHRFAVAKGLPGILAQALLARRIRARFSAASARVFIETGELPLLAESLQRHFGPESVILRFHASFDTEFLAWRNRLSDRINRVFLKRFVAHTPTIVATNRYHLGFVRDHFLSGNRYLLARKRMVSLANAIQLPELATSATPAALEGIRLDRCLLTLGRMNHPDDVAQKGFDDLLDALHLLGGASFLAERESTVLFVGQGEERARLQRRAVLLGLASHVRFIDQLSRAEISHTIQAVRACVLPSRYEGFSMFAGEAVAAGGILIGTRETGLEDLVKDAVSGYLFAPHDAGELAGRLRALFSLSDQQLATFRAAARAQFLELCNSEALAARFAMLWS